MYIWFLPNIHSFCYKVVCGVLQSCEDFYWLSIFPSASPSAAKQESYFGFFLHLFELKSWNLREILIKNKNMSVIEVTLRKILKMNIYGIEGGFYLNRKIQILQKPPFHPISNKTIWRRHCRVIFNSQRKQWHASDWSWSGTLLIISLKYSLSLTGCGIEY